MLFLECGKTSVQPHNTVVHMFLIFGETNRTTEHMLVFGQVDEFWCRVVLVPCIRVRIQFTF